MSILLVGGTGKVLTPLAQMLKHADYSVVITSRRGPSAAPPGLRAVKFDWMDPATYEEPFKNETYSAACLVAPWTNESGKYMNPFIDTAMKHGVNRFAVIAGLSVRKGGPWLGAVWQHLADAGAEYSIIRPTWFMDNLLDPSLHAVKSEHKIYSACADGKAPWIAADDIAQVTMHALTSKAPPAEHYDLPGPEQLTMDDIAATLTKVLGHKIEHVRLSDDDNLKRLQNSGIDDFNATLLARLEASTAQGNFEYKGPSDVQRLLGHPAIPFSVWAEKNKAGWL